MTKLAQRWLVWLRKWIVDRLVWLWWHTVAVARILWICRAAVLPVMVGIVLIGWTDQARDIVIADARPSWKGLPTLIAMLVAVTIWSTVAWYWSRVTVQYALINPPPPLPHQRWHAWLAMAVPRLIGTAGMLSVALAFWQAHKIYSYAGDDHRAGRFLGLMFLYLGVAGLFHIAVGNRTRIMQWLVDRRVVGADWLPDRTPSTEIFDRRYPFARRFLIATFWAAPLFYFLVVFFPVEMSDRVFRGAVPAALLGFALMVPVGCYLVMKSAEQRLPLFGGALAILVASPILFGDFHEVRTLRVASTGGKAPTCEEQDAAWTAKDDKRLMLKDAYLKWWEANEKLVSQPVDAKLKAPPLVMVATAGGASRAAFWTSQVLGEIARREPYFADRLFMISGVSGGSLGAVTFRSLVEADRRAGKNSTVLEQAPEEARRIIENDFLGPTFAAGLYVDLPSNGITILPRKILPDDRGVALEKAWEQAWKEHGPSDKFTWGQGFVETFGGDRPWPVLVLNGTSVERGKRIVTSNVRFWSPRPDGANLSGGINRYDTFEITKADIRISTAVTMSARFPVISPTGALRDCNGKAWTRVTDGGLFENFGAFTLDEVLRFLVLRTKEVQEAKDGKYQAMPVAILISSDPSLDHLHLREDGRPSTVAPDCAAAGGDHRPEPQQHPGNGWVECPSTVRDSAGLFVDPVTALYDGRVSRGEAAATAVQDRIADARIAVRNRLADLVDERKRNESAKPMSPAEVKAERDATLDLLRARLGTADHTDFFHFRQCRVYRRKSPTMSWHDSEEAWEVLRTMLGLDENSRDDCGNGAEFFRLCMRLTRLTDGADDRAASESCARKWPRPANWLCIETGGIWRCGLPIMKEPRRAR